MIRTTKITNIAIGKIYWVILTNLTAAFIVPPFKNIILYHTATAAIFFKQHLYNTVYLAHKVNSEISSIYNFYPTGQAIWLHPAQCCIAS